MNITPLQRFWMALNYEENKKHSDAEDAFEYAMDAEYHPIDTRFCMVKSSELGWHLLEASGTSIVRVIECGEMELQKLK